LHLVDQILAILVRHRRKIFVFYAAKPFSGGVFSNIHQQCVIITEAAEENDHADNAATHVQVEISRSNSKKEKEKIHVSTGEWRVIMSAINHGTEVPANSRREVLMGYQYVLHQHKKKLWEEKDEFRKSQKKQ
jgi:hypothetical protein